MRHPTTIRDDLTEARYGYKSCNLPPGSHQHVLTQCTNCSAVVSKEFRNSNTKHQCPIVVGTNKRCYGCELWLDLTLFPTNSRHSGGVGKLCKKCHNSHPAVKRYEERRCARLRTAIKDGDVDYYIQRRMKRLQSNAKNKGIPWTIDLAYLKLVWDNQNGNCYYTNIKMDGIGQRTAVWNSPSLDKMNPALGYIKGNVVWCIYSVNAFKYELTEDEFSDVVKKCKWWFNQTVQASTDDISK